MIFDQTEFELRCEWGRQGLAQCAPISDVVIIVDVLSFSTCVEIATNQGAMVIPYRWKDNSAVEFAQSINAELASLDRSERYSLSPTSLQSIVPGTRLVLPSPNGATLSMQTDQTPTLAGCLRNAQAIAQFAQSLGSEIAVIPAGEQWEDGSLRPAWEDWVGAGAILSHLKGAGSPEAEAAITAFQQIKHQLGDRLKQCSSGKELIDRGFTNDVDLAGELDVSHCVPLLLNGAYIKQPTSLPPTYPSQFKI